MTCLVMTPKKFMKKIVLLVLMAMSGTLTAGYVQAQANKLITGNSAGVIKLGMSAVRARQLVRPMKVSKGENVFEGDMLHRVTSGKKLVMTFIEYTKKITSIEVLDASYHTKKGAHVGMSLNALEKIYGKLKKIEYLGSEGGGPEGEFATFADQPKGVTFKVAVNGKGRRAGIYPKGESGEHPTTKYHSGVYLKSIGVGGE